MKYRYRKMEIITHPTVLQKLIHLLSYPGSRNIDFRSGQLES